MKDRYQIAVFTTDRDLQSATPYDNVVTGKWTSFAEGVNVFYCPPDRLTWKFILQQIKALNPDYIYLNSMYSRHFTIYPLMMRRLGLIKQRIILSPRGMLKSSALQFRKRKKLVFLKAMRMMGVQKLVKFHATDSIEENDIKLHFGQIAQVTTASNFGAAVQEYPGTIEKNPGELKIIFIGRLHPIKNLDVLLNLLPQVKGKISLTVVGSEEDKSYTAACKKIVQDYPSTLQVNFAGQVANKMLPQVIAQHHIFALPTRGENFGHAIFEALSAGRPVLISDQTPWRNLKSAKAGWDLGLDDRNNFIEALQQAANWDQQAFNEWSIAAWQHAAEFSEQPHLKQLYYNLFQ